MHRIDEARNVGNLFDMGDPAAGIKGTVVGAAWPNAVQEELINILLAAGITPIKGTWTQIRDALNILHGPGVRSNQKNLLINGTFNVWQRGSPIAVPPPGQPVGTSAYGPDRWVANAGSTGGAGNLTKGTWSPGVNPEIRGSADFLTWNQTTNAAGTAPVLAQRMEVLESTDTVPLTISVWLKISSGSINIVPKLVQNFGTGSPVIVAGPAFNVTTTLTRFSVTLTPPSISGKTVAAGNNLSFHLEAPLGVTFSITVNNAQVEDGLVATDFERPISSVQIMNCRRYFTKSYDVDTPPGTQTFVGALAAQEDVGTGCEGLRASLPMQMRTVGVTTWYPPHVAANAGAISRYNGAGGFTGETVTTTSYRSQFSTGVPITATSNPGFFSLAHYTIDAEL